MCHWTNEQNVPSEGQEKPECVLSCACLGVGGASSHLVLLGYQTHQDWQAATNEDSGPRQVWGQLVSELLTFTTCQGRGLAVLISGLPGVNHSCPWLTGPSFFFFFFFALTHPLEERVPVLSIFTVEGRKDKTRLIYEWLPVTQTVAGIYWVSNTFLSNT